jgi:ribosomal protein S18 acetylase RimI-like enzyme
LSKVLLADIIMDNQSENLAARLSFRPAVFPEDEDFLMKLYFTTRADVEMSPLTHYAAQFPEAAYNIVLLDAQPIGRLMVERGADEIRVIDISLLPVNRSQGIGTILLQDLIDEAGRTNRTFGLHVVQNNRAVRLYERLGLSVTGETGFHFKMELPPTNEK